MSQQLKNIIKQPLLHFLLIGGLLFALYYVVNPGTGAKDTIVIDDEQVSRMLTVFQKEWSRLPTNLEMKGLMDRHIQQEVYYRKALLMNLDHNDEIIRRRLDQKLRFVTNDLANLKEPKEEELKSFYHSNQTRYLLPKRYSFSHIYFNPDKREHANQDAAKILSELPVNDEKIEELVQKGDAFPFAYRIDSLTEAEIAREMGDQFIMALADLPIHKWVGPLMSGYGTHLIYIKEVKEQAEPKFALIREAVLRDYHYDLQEQYNKQLYEEFKKDFTIKLVIKDAGQYKQLSQLMHSNVNE